MCGLTGGWAVRDFGALHDALPRMTTALAHRGPDDVGYWCDPEPGIALGHRRLAVVDLSPQGHQPMVSESGRYVLAFNGEIYNHTALREALTTQGAAPRWRGHSDTETLLAAVEAQGLPDALKSCIGMFAIAMWDRSERELWLARDRFGEKPLYYGLNAGNLLFGSELKALALAPGFTAEINRDAIALLLRQNAIPAPHSIYRGIAKLAPGTWLRVRQYDLEARELPAPVPYWSVADAAAASRRSPFTGTAAEATERLEALLGDAVSQQMMADVPLGAFLSGGVDSSTVVALMQAQSSRPIKTFSIGFHEPEYDEAGYAKAVASHLGTEHTELYVSPVETLAVIPRLPEIFNEPFSDSSQIATFLVSRMAREHVTVSLSGDAGDELFLGYPRYKLAASIKQRGLLQVPRPIGRLMAGVARSVPEPVLTGVAKAARALDLDSRLQDINRHRMLRLADVLTRETADGGYAQLMTHWPDAHAVVVGAQDLPTTYDRADYASRNGDFPLLLGELDLQAYLPDDILVKVDRAAMAVSLETRVPLLDHRVVEFALSVPLSLKWRAGQTKWLLRQVLYRHVPRALIDRPKMGFGVPIGKWLRGPLRDWAEDLLAPARLVREGFFNPGPITAKWQEHSAGKRDWQYPLWDVLMFQAWLASR